jgi:hypothetical protein
MQGDYARKHKYVKKEAVESSFISALLEQIKFAASGNY